MSLASASVTRSAASPRSGYGCFVRWPESFQRGHFRLSERERVGSHRFLQGEAELH